MREEGSSINGILSRKKVKRHLLHKEIFKSTWAVSSGERLEIIIMEKSDLQVDNKGLFTFGKANSM